MNDHSHLIESLKRDEQQQDAIQNALQAPSEPSDQEDVVTWPKGWDGRFLDRFDQPMSFREFLHLKKEALEAFGAYSEARIEALHAADEKLMPPWPEALKGLTREDIEILKL